MKTMKYSKLNIYMRAVLKRAPFQWIPDAIFLRMYYRLKMKKKLNLDNPQTYNEKLQWLKVFDRNPLYTQLVDKYAVREHIAQKIGGEYLIPLIGGPWTSFDDIDFGALPDQFVLKCNHDSGGLIICKDKLQLNLADARKKLNHCLKRNYYYRSREWPYKNVPARIIAEQYMEDDSGIGLRDYKFFCFNGEPKAMFIATERANLAEETKFDFFDMDFNYLPFINGHPNAKVLPKCPESFEQMKQLAAILSKELPQARVDFYDINGRIYFGEITLFHWSGFMKFEPEEWDRIFGSWIQLPRK